MRFKSCLVLSLISQLFAAQSYAQIANNVPQAWSSEPLLNKLQDVRSGTIKLMRFPEAHPTAVKIDPIKFDKIVGAYEVTPVRIFYFSRKDDQLFVSSTGTGFLSNEPAIEVFAEGANKFFTKDDSELFDFVFGKNGAVMGFNYRWPNDASNTFIKKVDPASAQQGQLALKDRIKRHQASPEMAAALRRAISGILSGHPVYGEMTPEFAADTKKFVSDNPLLAHKLGALKLIRFDRDETGSDYYDVEFEHARTEWVVMPLTPDGKIFRITFYFEPEAQRLRDLLARAPT